PAPVFDAARRSTQTEILDGEISTADLAAVLRDLARFNGVMLGHWPVIWWFDAATAQLPRDEPLTVLDIGCGYGDLLRSIRDWARKRNRAMRLIGIDLSAQVIEVARGATPAADDIEYHVSDIFAFRRAAPIDFSVTSLVAHHLTNEMIVRFLRWMEDNSRHGWMI